MSSTSPCRARRLCIPAVVAVAALAVFPRLAPGPDPAGAVVEESAGYSATVAGWTSWYGSYGLADLGAGWCIDHGLRPPDPDLGYEPTAVDDQSPATRAAVAWAVGAYGLSPDPDRGAAVMLAVHDVMGAVYPTGPLDVDALDPSQLAGFDGHEADILALAQAIKADALAHSGLVGPVSMSIAAPAVPPGAVGELVVQLADAEGRPVSGVAMSLYASGATLGTGTAITGADGIGRVPFTSGAGLNAFAAVADPPDPLLHAYASTSAPAQRVAVPAASHLKVETAFVTAAPTTLPPTTLPPTTLPPTTLPPTTTSTTTTSTTTTTTTSTPPSTTSTLVAATTVVPTTSTTSTTAPAPTSTSTTTTTGPVTSAPPSTPATVQSRPPLPRTGSATMSLVATGAGLTVLGVTVVVSARRRATRSGPRW